MAHSRSGPRVRPPARADPVLFGGMSEPIDNPPPRRPMRFLAGALQVLGFAGTSHLLHQAVSLFPSYATSDLADLAKAAPLFTSAGPQEVAEVVVLFALLPALLEELLFRGVLFAIFERLRGPTFAIGASALLFGIAHLDLHHGFVAALLGIQLGLLRHLHGLRLAIVAHFLNNTLALGATFLAEAEGHGLPAFESGPGSLILALLLSGSAWAALVHRQRSFLVSDRRSGTDLQTPDQSDD